MTIASSVIEDVIAHARAASPDECCGILLGSRAHISENVRAVNSAERPSARFVIDPQDHINARRLARAKQLEVVGFYHSHPHSAAQPSPTDLAEATYEDAVHVIVGFAGQAAEVRAFRYVNGTVFEADWEVLPRSEF